MISNSVCERLYGHVQQFTALKEFGMICVVVDFHFLHLEYCFPAQAAKSWYSDLPLPSLPPYLVMSLQQMMSSLVRFGLCFLNKLSDLSLQ